MIFNLGKDYIRSKDGNYTEVNMVDVMGKCIKDAEVDKTQNGKIYAKASIVVETYKDGTGKFVNLKAWAGSFDYEAVATLKKNQTIRLIGYFTTGEYNGKTYENFNIVWVGTEMSLLPPKTSASKEEFKAIENEGDLPF